MSDSPILSILVKTGTYDAMTTLAMVVSGAVAIDFEVRIFAMEDAVWALKKDVIGTDTKVHSHFPEFAEKFVASEKVTPWWELMTDLKDFGEITIKVCALVTEILELEKDDFSELVDGVAGVAGFAADVDASDWTLTI